MLTSINMTRFRARTEDRIQRFYELHAPAALALTVLLVGDRQQAEDLLQDAFVRVLGRFDHVRDPSRFGAYLRRTIVNLHLSRLRRLRLEREHSRRLTTERAPETMPVSVEGLQDLASALQRLPRRQRAAVVLRYYEDLSERDVAEVLQCSVSAAKSLTARGVRALRTLLREGE